MFETLGSGLAAVLTLESIAWVVLGCLAGTLIGLLPGLGPITAIALMIPVSYALDPAAGMIMMAGVYYGAVFGGSTSSILINAPGVASTVATSFDGYPMARDGLAGKALTVAAYASFAGGTLGALLLMLFASSISAIAVDIQSPEYCLIMLIALSSVVVFSGPGQVVKAAVTTLLGLMLATVGADQISGVERFTLGRMDLTDGVSFILVAMATFALAEALRMTIFQDPPARPAARLRLGLPVREVAALAPTGLRASLLGFIVGVMPGAGATLASFFAYSVEKRVGSASREAGVAAPEAANNAACTGSFVPLLTLGVPGSGTTAVLLGVMLSYGLQPGPTLITEEPALFWGVILSMYIGNAVLLLLNLPLIPFLARLIYLPRRRLIPVIVALSVVGVYLTSFNTFDVLVMTGLAGLALLLRVTGFPLAPLLLGFILSDLLEENAVRTAILFEGRWLELLQRPLTLALVLAGVIVWCIPLLRRLRGVSRGAGGE